MNALVSAVPDVAPHLELKALLGAGSMGSVWSAHHRELGEVAVKLIDPALMAEHPEALERLRFEAEAVWCIDSLHVTAVHERGVSVAGQPYIVMELLHGETLEQRIERADDQGALPISECLWILEQTAWALTAAHAAGIVHRDLKPENIFLCRRDQVPFVKLLDFGIAKRPSGEDLHVTRPGTLLGTPYYMSKEQLLSSTDVDHRADLWAFAVVAYEVLTGCVPFMGDNLGHLIRSVFHGSFEPLAQLRPELSSPALEAWFARAFDADIEQRFSSVGEMAAALRAALPEDLDDQVSGIRRIVRDEEHGRTACWSPEGRVAAALVVSQVEPLATSVDGSANVDATFDGVPVELPLLPRHDWLPGGGRTALALGALSAIVGALSLLL